MNVNHLLEANASAAEREHSQALMQIIQTAVTQAGGAISFSQFMSLALYHPEFGYYMNEHEKFGPRGDFITAPLVSPLYAQTMARSIFLDIQQHPFILEWGAGNGQLAKDMLTYFASQGLHPQYYIYDISPACRVMQREHLKLFGEQVKWIEVPPESFKGVIIANEVLDALPVDLFHYVDGMLFERAVTCVNDRLEYIDRPANEFNVKTDLSDENKIDYISEKHIFADDLLRTWLSLLKDGKIIIIDYGFLRHEYYHPERSRGTLMCHYHHHAHDDAFFLPGRQDITAHVNFSDLIDIATEQKCDVTLYTQAQYLIEHGLLDLAQASFSEDIAQQRLVSQAIRLLLEPQEMGEFFKVFIISKSAASLIKGPVAMLLEERCTI
jgi:SAM-dependent MidA family methyltransferase